MSLSNVMVIYPIADVTCHSRPQMSTFVVLIQKKPVDHQSE